MQARLKIIEEDAARHFSSKQDQEFYTDLMQYEETTVGINPQFHNTV